jgi:hypothetical protein
MSVDRIIIKSKDFDPRKLSFKEVRTLKDIGAQFAPVEYDGKKLYLQTPEMIVPYGISQYKGKEGEEPDENAPWSVDLSFSGHEDNPEISEFMSKLHAVEDIIKEFAYQNNWKKDNKSKDPKKRNKSVSKEVLQTLISSIVRYSTGPKSVDSNGNPKYPPTMKIKVPCVKGNFLCEVYDEDKNPVTVTPLNQMLIKGTRAKCLLECGAVFIGSNISLTWKLSQVKIRQSGRVAGYGFIDDSDGEGDGEGEEDNSKPAAKQTKTPTKTDKSTNKKVEMVDSDDNVGNDDDNDDNDDDNDNDNNDDNEDDDDDDEE